MSTRAHALHLLMLIAPDGLCGPPDTSRLGRRKCPSGRASRRAFAAQVVRGLVLGHVHVFVHRAPVVRRRVGLLHLHEPLLQVGAVDAPVVSSGVAVPAVDLQLHRLTAPPPSSRSCRACSSWCPSSEGGRRPQCASGGQEGLCVCGKKLSEWRTRSLCVCSTSTSCYA